MNESVNICLIFERKKVLKFWRFKKACLHNIAKSLVTTFPRLAEDSEGNDTHANTTFICFNIFEFGRARIFTLGSLEFALEPIHFHKMNVQELYDK